MTRYFIRLLSIALLLVLVTLPGFARMLKFGIYTMHDFHVFRMHEYNECIKDGVFPCVWARNSGFGYGEPIFNFYPSLSYIIVTPLLLAGLSIINTTKIAFILSLLLSSVTMFMLSRKLWKNNFAALTCSVLYVNAPYRALDVWVRGALPESMAFVFFPLVIFFLELYLESKNTRTLVGLAASLSALFLTHNLSAVMFTIFLIPYAAFRILRQGIQAKAFIPLIAAIILSLGLASYQLIPVILEMKYINIQKTLDGYYDFRAHFVTLNQLFLSRQWGYGASLWGPVDNISFSTGQIHWLTAAIVLAVSIARRRVTPIIIVGIGLFALFLTHNQSTFIWEKIRLLHRLQFPWRWLSISTFSFALASGSIIHKQSKGLFLALVISIAAITLNLPYSRPDIWLSISDEEQFAGGRFDEQRASAVNDFWPKFGSSTPSTFAPDTPTFTKGRLSRIAYTPRSHSSLISVTVDSMAQIIFPTVYFPGWKLFDRSTKNETPITLEEKLGLISVELPPGDYELQLRLTDTLPRQFGKLATLVSILVSLYVIVKPSKYA